MKKLIDTITENLFPYILLLMGFCLLAFTPHTEAAAWLMTAGIIVFIIN